MKPAVIGQPRRQSSHVWFESVHVFRCSPAITDAECELVVIGVSALVLDLLRVFRLIHFVVLSGTQRVALYCFHQTPSLAFTLD